MHNIGTISVDFRYLQSFCMFTYCFTPSNAHIKLIFNNIDILITLLTPKRHAILVFGNIVDIVSILLWNLLICSLRCILYYFLYIGKVIYVKKTQKRTCKTSYHLQLFHICTTNKVTQSN